VNPRLADAWIGLAAAVGAAILAPWWCALAVIALAGALVYRATAQPPRRPR
jgi:hypothetical protein